jgi:hypothetical protein
MPSEDYNRLTDADLGALVAYVKRLAPAAGEGLVARIPPLVKTLYAVGVIRDAAEKIDHRLPPSAPVAEDGSATTARTSPTAHRLPRRALSGGRSPARRPDGRPR